MKCANQIFKRFEGNCKTVMIATISSENDSIEELLSTLRFSQRLVQLQNEIRQNEKANLEAVVKRFAQEKLVLIRELEQYQKEGSQSNKKNQQQQLNFITIIKWNDQQQKDIQEKVELYFNKRIPILDAKSIKEIQKFFETMNDRYTRMKEYVTERSFNSEKLKKYDEINKLSNRKEYSSFFEQKENSFPQVQIQKKK